MTSRSDGYLWLCVTLFFSFFFWHVEKEKVVLLRSESFVVSLSRRYIAVGLRKACQAVYVRRCVAPQPNHVLASKATGTCRENRVPRLTKACGARSVIVFRS